MTRKQPKPLWTPRFARFLPSLRQAEEGINQNIFMFVEDISYPVPLHRTRKNGPSVNLTGSEDAQRKTLQLLDELSEHAGYSAEEKLANAINTLAKGIAWEGRVQFELIPRDDGTTFFHRITTKRSLRFLGFLIQYLGPEDREFWKSSALRWAPLSAIWHIDVPDELGGRRGYKRLLLGLKKFNNLGPRFVSSDWEHGGNPSNFDIAAYARSNNIFRFKITHAWGWNCRDLSTDRTTEFYNMYRSAAAEKSQVILRNHIIAQINLLLRRMKIECTMSMEGLLSLETAERLTQELVNGRMSFKEFLDIKYGT